MRSCRSDGRSARDGACLAFTLEERLPKPPERLKGDEDLGSKSQIHARMAQVEVIRPRCRPIVGTPPHGTALTTAFTKVPAMVLFEVSAKVPANTLVSRSSASPRRHCDAHQSVRCAPAPWLQAEDPCPSAENSCQTVV